MLHKLMMNQDLEASSFCRDTSWGPADQQDGWGVYVCASEYACVCISCFPNRPAVSDTAYRSVSGFSSSSQCWKRRRVEEGRSGIKNKQRGKCRKTWEWEVEMRKKVVRNFTESGTFSPVWWVAITQVFLDSLKRMNVVPAGAVSNTRTSIHPDTQGLHYTLMGRDGKPIKGVWGWGKE